MALTAQQIVTIASQIAKAPGMGIQAGQFLNAVLQDLCNDYDLDLAKTVFSFQFNSGAAGGGGFSSGFSPGFTIGTSGVGVGSGPYILPPDYLRAAVSNGKDGFVYVINGVPYPPIQVSITEYKWLVQTPGFQSYPYYYATDMSRQNTLGPGGTGVPLLFVWPPASGAYPCTLPYYRAMPDIASPETSTTIPWFPNSEILIRGVAGRLMQITGDNRAEAYLGEDPDRFPMGFKALLNAYLKNVKDREGAVETVGLDRRRWGRPFDRLKNTKQIGW